MKATEGQVVLDEAHALVARGGGVLVLSSGAGMGKTRAVLSEVWPELRRQGWRGSYHGPSRAMRDEAALVADEAGLSVARWPGVGEAGASWSRGGCVDPHGIERAQSAHPEGAARHCQTCPARAGCPIHSARAAAAGAPSETLRVSTSAAYVCAPPDPRGRQVLIIDEAFLGHVCPEHGLDAAALAALRADGVQVGDGLVEALALSCETRKTTGRARAGWTLASLAPMLGVGVGDLLRVDAKTSTRAAAEAYLRGDLGAASPGPWQALDALRARARAGTLGEVRVAHGRLWVCHVTAPTWRPGDLILVLDATASLDVVRAFWPTAPIVEVYGAPLHRPEVVHIEATCGVVRGGTKDGRARSLAGREAALAGRLVAQGEAVGWGAKSDLFDDEHPMHVVPLDTRAWSYHGSSLSRGSNAWASLPRAVVLPYHVPTHSIDALAGALQARDPGACDVWRVEVDEAGRVSRRLVRAGGIDAAGWREVAREQLVDAQVYQEAHRVRGLRYPGRQVVLVGARVPRWLRQEAARVVEVPSWGVWAVQGGGMAHVDGLWAALIGAAVGAHGGAWCGQAHPMTVGEARAALRLALPPVLRDLDPLPCDLDPLPLVQALGQDWARRYIEGGGGLVVRQVRGPSGRVGVACDETCAALDEGALQARLWPTWAAGRQDVGGALRRAVEALQGRALTWAALVEVGGGSRWAWRRRLVEAGLPTVLDEAAAVALMPQTPQNLTALDACGGVQVLADAPKIKTPLEPMRAPAHLDARAVYPPDGASEQATPAREVACPEDTPAREAACSDAPPARVPEVWRPVDVWRLADALDAASPTAHRLRVLRGVPGPWPVAAVVRAVGLCHVLRAGA